MAKIEIIDNIKIKSFMVNGLMDVNFKVDIDFDSYESLSKIIERGFDPELWENKNNQKVLVKGKHYTED